MKKALLAVIALSFFSTLELSAQCIPDASITVPGIYPDSATNLDTAMVSQFYSDTLQFKVYTTVPPLVVDSIRVMSIAGLPSGFNASSTPASMLFLGGSNGCILIQGTTPGPAATYPLTVNLRFYVHIPVPFTAFVIDTIADDYRIVVEPFSGIQTYNANTFDLLQNYPNPFNTQTEIAFTAPTVGKVDFRVYDLLGREMIVRSIEAVPGLNKITLSSRYFKPGIYFYKLNYKNKSLTRKMIVSAKP